MATGSIPDPYGSYNFLIEIDGIARGAFQECSGFDSTIEVIEHREGGQNTHVHKLAGLNKFSNITLKWGVTDDRDLYDWHRKVVSGEMDRRNGSIVLLNKKGEEVVRWNFYQAWPTKYDGPDFNAEKSEAAIEKIELALDTLERV